MGMARIYVMRSVAERWVKVGRSIEPVLRNKTLRYTDYGPLTIEFATEPLSNAKEVEWTAHTLLINAGLHIGRTRVHEKFSASIDEATEAIRRSIRICSGREPAIERIPAPRGTTKVMRVYRLQKWLVEKLKAFRNEQKMRPSETAIVQAAIDDFIDRQRDAAKKGSRR